MNKIELLETLEKYHLDKDKYVVLSTGSLVVQGIKDNARDIDIAVSEDYFKYLLENYECKLEYAPRNAYEIDGIINFGPNYYDTENVIYVNGIRFQNLKSVMELKKNLGREKDYNDIMLIENYLNKNVLALAYLGDSVYEIYVRKYLLNKNIEKVDILQQESINYVSAKNQAKYLLEMIDKDFFNPEELDIIKRGRNHKSRNPKHVDTATYHNATGFETLIGYLYLLGDNKRINEIMEYILK